MRASSGGGEGGKRTRDNEIDRLDRCEGGHGDLLLGLFVVCRLPYFSLA